MLGRIWVAIFFAIALLAIPLASPVLGAEEGSISGQLVNNTAGGSPVGGTELTLTTFKNGLPGLEQKVLSDSSGKFQFNGLSLDAGNTYGISTRFQDAGYFSQPITLTADTPTQAVAIDVYDSTTSDEFIRAVNGHLLVKADQGAVQVLEVWRFVNSGDRTYIGAAGKTPRTTLRFTLPAGATTVSPGEGFAPVTTETGVADTLPVMPGPTDISFTYVLHYQGSGLTLSRKADYATASFGILVEDTGVKVSSVALGKPEPLNMGTAKYLFLSKKDIAAGTDFDASFTDLDKVSTGGTTSPGQGFPWSWLVSGILAIALVAVLVYPQLRKRQAIASPGDGEAETTDNPESPDEDKTLLQELALLDDDYEAGKIKAPEYKTRRAQTKARLLEVRARKRGGEE